jgi:transmembrane sensor
MMEENEYITLILKHLDGETDEAEEAGLQQWLDADPDHRREYRELEKIWKDSGKMQHDRVFDKDAAWEKVGAGLAIRPSAEDGVTLADGSPSVRALRKRWGGGQFARGRWMVAAAVLLVVFAVTLWWRSGEASRSVRVAAEANDAAVKHVILPDGSEVDLRKGAVLHYREPFGGGDREVELSGEAWFQLSPDRDHPFRILTAHAIIEDIGTSFVVNGQEALDEVSVSTGKVRFMDRAYPSNGVVLTAGRRGVLQGQQFMQSGVKTLHFAAWKTGVLDFQDEPLETAAAAIGDFYQLPVWIAPDLRPDAGKITLHSRFDHQPLKEVLEEVRLTTGLAIRQERDTLVFSRK